MKEFAAKVLNFVRKIPAGRVVSYGQVAAACGHPRAARQVGGILRGLDIAKQNIPWWRVVNSRGEISIKGNWTATKEMQTALLRQEGVTVGKHLIIDLDKFGWRI